MHKQHLHAIILVVIVTVFNAVGQLFLKIGMTRFVPTVVGIVTNIVLILGVVLYAISMLIFVSALKKAPLSHLFPFMALTFIWVLLLSAFFLKEPVTALDTAGIILISGGVALVGGGSK